MKNMMINGPILNRIYDNVKVSKEQKESNIHNAFEIYNKIPNGYNSLTSNVGLVVGKVQSGKTANIIALTGMAFDNNHRLCIMLLSDTNNLLDQNSDRIKESFNGIDKVVVFKKSSNGDFDDLEKVDIDYLYDNGYKVIICSLKHYKHISDITKKLANTGFLNDYSLIIDDESDDISQNTDKDKFAFNESGIYENERSSTNASIIELKNSLLKNSYISVTATPQANILLQKFQSLAPNFCVTIQPGKGYTGLNSFHSQNSNKVVVIKDFSKENLKNNTLPNIPNSLYDALLFFVAGAIVRVKRETEEFKHSFLIHPSKRIVDHQKLYDSLDALINNKKYGVCHRNNTGIDFFKDVLKKYTEITNKDNITIDDVENMLKSLRVHCINGLNDVNNLQQKMKVLPFHIVIGGDMLDRGITIPGLAVSYMTRESKIGQVDTLLQRARWFGYKSSIFDVCRVYLTEQLKQQFEEIIEHEDSLWDFLTYCSDLTYDIRNEKVELVINSNLLKPTNQSKADFDFNKLNSVESQKVFTINNNYNNDNITLLKKYEELNGEILRFNDTQQHKCIKITFKDFREILFKFHFQDKSYTNQDSFNYENIINICNRLNIDDDEPIDLLRMRIHDNEKRSTVDINTCKILNLMQGRSEGKDVNDNGFYQGDRYIVNDNIMIQVHHVILKNDVCDYYKTGDEVIMLSILFPKKYAMQGVVTRKQVSELARKFY